MSDLLNLRVSTDDGASWREIHEPMPDATPQVITRNGSVLYAGAHKTHPLNNLGGGVFRSTDDGETWNAGGLSGVNVHDLVVTPNGNLFAGTDNGVSRSTDEGATWTAASAGLPNTYVRTLIFKSDGAGGTFLFAGTSGPAPAGVFRSTNDGDTWSQFNSGINATSITNLAVDSAGRIYAATQIGPYRSTNNGSHWTLINGDMPPLARVHAFALKSDGMGGTIIIATSGGPGIWRSTNDGLNWNIVDAGGLTLIFWPAVNHSAPNGGALYAGGGIGFYRSTDNGLTWLRGNLYNSIVVDFAVVPHGERGSRVFACRDGIYQSTNLGNEWSNLLVGGFFNAMAVNASSPGNPSVFAASTGGLLRSTNNGDNWENVSGIFNDNNILSVLATPDGSGGTLILAGTFDGLWISSNDGGHWIESNNGILNTIIVSLGAIPNPGGNPTLLAGSYGNGIYRSTNNGTSWSEANSGLTNLDIRAFAHSGQKTFVATEGDGIFVSSNNGTTWNQVNNGLTNTTVWKLTAVPGFPGNIIAGTNGGVFLTTNNGEAWTSIGSGLPPVAVYSVTLAADDMGYQYLLAGTAWRGVWKRPLSEIVTSVPITSGTVPSEFSLSQNHPNPFNPSTVISFALPHPEFVLLRILDALGQEIDVVMNEHLREGTHQVEWRPQQNIASGVYFYRIEAGSFVQTRKLAFIK
jgi:photosystem II stability/assembly factor-like uncharacterized protein